MPEKLLLDACAIIAYLSDEEGAGKRDTYGHVSRKIGCKIPRMATSHG